MKLTIVAAALVALASPAKVGGVGDERCRLLQEANIALGIMLKREQSEKTILKARLIREIMKLCEKAKVECDAQELWERFS